MWHGKLYGRVWKPKIMGAGVFASEFKEPLSLATGFRRALRLST